MSHQSRPSPNKGSPQPQKVFAPKNHLHTRNSNSKNPNPNPNLNSNPTTLSNSLRQSRAAAAAEKSGNFVNYLPQDDAVAAGLSADEGGLDAVESQSVVDLLNRELSRLLKLNAKDFWREVASDTSLHEFLDSFLQFRTRWYDFPHRGPKETVAGVIVGESELIRRVFMVLYRISSNRDPGARAADSLSVKDHGVILQEKKLLDLPKLLDICAIYGQENGNLTSILVKNALTSQPWIHDDLSSVISQFLSIVHTMHQRCSSSLEVLLSSGSQPGSIRLCADMLEVMDFINDAIVSMDAFVNAYKPAALFFSFPVEIRDGNEELLCTLAKLHDSLIPSLQSGFRIISSSEQDATIPNMGVGLNLLTKRIIDFGWNLLNICYLSEEAFGGDFSIPAATKMFPANIEDPFIRTDILVQTFREISAVSISSRENQNWKTLLQNIDKYFHVMSNMENLQSTGWIFIDNEQLEYVSGVFASSNNATVSDFNNLQSSAASNQVGVNDDSVIMESKISQIKDLFPDYGKGFLAACLEAYNHNPEEVVQRILEGTLHEDLQALNISMETMPVSKTATTMVSRTDKGKGKLVESAPPMVSSKIVAGKSAQQNEGPLVSSSSSTIGRFVRKSKTNGPDSDTLDSRNEKDYARTSALLLQYEYEDEYDDSFDDLGLSVGETGLEENEIFSDKISSNKVKSWEQEAKNPPPLNPSDSSRWGSRKKPQYYVKDGKNYSYKVEGSVAVANSSEASLVTRAQGELIHGLGQGGNLPLGAVKELVEFNEEQERQKDALETEERFGNNRGRGSGRGRRGGARSNGEHEKQSQGSTSEAEGPENSGGNGNHRGRGRRGGGGGRNTFRKDRAAAKHFSGLGRF